MVIGKEYISAMLKTLDAFCDEIHKFHIDQGSDWAINSPAAKEFGGSKRPESLVTAWSQAALLVESGSEHLSSFIQAIEEPVQSIACCTCVRSMLEPCSLSSWLLDPGIDARTRIGRSFAVRYEGMNQFIKYARATRKSNAFMQPMKKRIREVEMEALKLGYPKITDRAGKRRLGIGQRMPSATELVKKMLDQEAMYRLLSAVAHGHDWAIRELSYGPVKGQDHRSSIGGSPVTMFEKTVDPKKIAWLGLISLGSLSRPVWYKCLYAGWDKERMKEILDRAFDSLSAREGPRFWNQSINP